MPFVAKYNDPAVMKAKVEEFIELCAVGKEFKVKKVKNQKEIETTSSRRTPLTLASICLHLGFVKSSVLIGYAKKSPEWAEVVDWIRLCVEKDALEGGLTGEYESKMTQLHLITGFGYTSQRSEEKNTVIHDISSRLEMAMLKSRPDYKEPFHEITPVQSLQNDIKELRQIPMPKKYETIDVEVEKEDAR